MYSAQAPLHQQKASEHKHAPAQRHARSSASNVLEDNRTQQPGSAPVQRQPNRTGLPDSLKSGMESLSGMSLDSRE
ncbi:hypothetical protein BIT28_23390 [Photobacterium proteolyticum]|uniref:Uncharacterized protein n=1 Tax=Photobacterium proteolyticum TaxID=1903952 RepID=A0A1Q9GMD0_9GAMM|nr:hypothetical protein [Photobacterium proteolyticum]OLQ75713.1 hypothetical protein BIT28_23390 [Photobacterium proteolyticum]